MCLIAKRFFPLGCIYILSNVPPPGINQAEPASIHCFEFTTVSSPQGYEVAGREVEQISECCDTHYLRIS